MHTAQTRQATRLKQLRRIAAGAESDSSSISLRSHEDPAFDENSEDSGGEEPTRANAIASGQKLALRRDEAMQAKKRRRALGLPDPPTGDITQSQLDLFIAAHAACDHQGARDIAAAAISDMFTGGGATAATAAAIATAATAAASATSATDAPAAASATAATSGSAATSATVVIDGVEFFDPIDQFSTPSEDGAATGGGCV